MCEYLRKNGRRFAGILARVCLMVIFAALMLYVALSVGTHTICRWGGWDFGYMTLAGNGYCGADGRPTGIVELVSVRSVWAAVWWWVWAGI